MKTEKKAMEISLYWDREETATVISNLSTIVSFHISFKHKPEILRPEEIYPDFHRYIQHEKVAIMSHYGNEKAVDYANAHFRKKDGTYKCVPLRECISQLIRLSEPNNYSEIECYPARLEIRRGTQYFSSEFYELRAADIGFEYKVIIDVMPCKEYLNALDFVKQANRPE